MSHYSRPVSGMWLSSCVRRESTLYVLRSLADGDDDDDDEEEVLERRGGGMGWDGRDWTGSECRWLEVSGRVRARWCDGPSQDLRGGRVTRACGEEGWGDGDEGEDTSEAELPLFDTIKPLCCDAACARGLRALDSPHEWDVSSELCLCLRCYRLQTGRSIHARAGIFFFGLICPRVQFVQGFLCVHVNTHHLHVCYRGVSMCKDGSLCLQRFPPRRVCSSSVSQHLCVFCCVEGRGFG